MGSLYVLMCLATMIHQSAGLNFTLDCNLSTMKEEVQKEILDCHNNIRRSVIPTASNMLKMKASPNDQEDHNTKLLNHPVTQEWSHEAASDAQRWANKCTLKVSEFSNRTTGDTVCSENVFASSLSVCWKDVILAWKLQKKNFIYGVGAINQKSHYLAYIQMIFYRTYKIGCGVSYCPNNIYKYFYVCQYCPARNEVTSLATPYKEGDRCADCPYSCYNGLCTNPCQYEDKYSNCQQLKDQLTCDFIPVKLHCKATCMCTSEIK